MKCSSCGGDCIPIEKIDEKIKEYQKRNIDIRNSSMCIPEWLENNEIRILALEDLKNEN